MAKFDSQMHEARWNRTVRAVDANKRKSLYWPPRVEDPNAPHGRYDGLFVIGRDMPRVIDGVYMGSSREAISVQEYRLENGRRLETLLPGYFDFFNRVFKERYPDAVNARSRVMTAAYFFTQELFGGDAPDLDEKVEVLSRELQAEYGDHPVPLEEFAEERLGVCRHRALFLAYMFERLLRDPGYSFRGTFSLDRNEVRENGRSLGAHVWVRYTNSTGDIFIFDPMQNQMGLLETFANGELFWDYVRSEDETYLSRRGINVRGRRF